MIMNKKNIALLLCLGLALVTFGHAHGSDPVAQLTGDKQEPEEARGLSEAEIRAEINILQDRIKMFQEAENDKVAKALGVTPAQLKGRTEKAQATQVFYNRMLAALKKTAILAAEKKTLEEAIASGEAFEVAESPPYSLKFYDEAIVAFNKAASARETAQMSLALSGKMVKNARQRLKDAEQQLREAKAAAGQAKESAEVATLQWKSAARQADVELARAALRFETVVLKNAETSLVVSELRTTVAERRLAQIRANLHFDAEDLEKQLSRIEEEKVSLMQAADEFLARQQKTEADLLRTQKKEEESADRDENMEAEIAALQAWRQTCQRGLEQIEGSLQLLTFQKEIWGQRYELIKGDTDAEELRLWQKEAQAQQDRILQALALEQSLQASLHLQISQVEKQLAEEGVGWTRARHLKEQLEAHKKLARSTFAYLGTLTVTNRMASHFIDEVDEELAGNILKEKIQILAGNIQKAWKFEVMVVDDQGITVGKITIALLLLIFGIILAGYFTRALKRHILDRSHLSESATAIAEKLLYYLTLLIVILLSMRVVNIPLTAFAFLGGALAIGVGFGGQKIISNFISGFILMAEQPVKVGDLIQMADIIGKVEEIGARATRVRTFANIHVLVPNSYFLENNIINWTHSDKIIRGEITVGVVYGSPTHEVRRLLMLAVREHKETLDYPKPYVFFNDFGDNALIFTVYFWITVQLINDKKRIESDMRFIIDEMFREAGLVIAFPQRDVHLDTSSPLRLEIMDASGRQEDGAHEAPGGRGDEAAEK